MQTEQVSVNHKFTMEEIAGFAQEQARLLGEKDSLAAQLDSAGKRNGKSRKEK